jgi:hypothetical protein
MIGQDGKVSIILRRSLQMGLRVGHSFEVLDTEKNNATFSDQSEHLLLSISPPVWEDSKIDNVPVDERRKVDCDSINLFPRMIETREI